MLNLEIWLLRCFASYLCEVTCSHKNNIDMNCQEIGPAKKMHKKRNKQTCFQTSKSKKQKTGTVSTVLLNLFRKQYGASCLHDKYAEAFCLVKARFSQIQRVLYPGCYLHITPSLYFPEVVYVDKHIGNSNALQKFFSDEEVFNELVRIPGKCPRHRFAFHQVDYSQPFGEQESSFDMLISLNAGLISKACEKYIKPGGILLVNNEHGDASFASTISQLSLQAVLHYGKSGQLLWDTAAKTLDACFTVKSTGLAITREQAISNSRIGRSKWRNKINEVSSLRELAYVFRKLN